MATAEVLVTQQNMFDSEAFWNSQKQKVEEVSKD